MGDLREPVVGTTYRHYKGGLYEIVCTGRLSEQRDVVCVVYRSQEKGCIWIRPLSMWSEPVAWPDGLKRERFTKERMLTKAAKEAFHDDA